jgi:poly(A) polymerase
VIEASAVEPLALRVQPVTERFIDAGFKLYLVGGVVRDLALTAAAGAGDGPASPDIDLTTDAAPGEIKALVSPVAEALWAQGERFGTIGARVGGAALEITTHRAERYDPESRKPVVTFGRDLSEDLSRRDFTVNAMAIELPTMTVHDPYRGLADLEQQLLRTPLSPEVSFTDDPLRILRAARFCARFDLTPVPELLTAATDLADRLTIVSVERVNDELERLLATSDPTAGLRLLADVGALPYIVPGLEVGDGPQGAQAMELALTLAATAGADRLVRRAGLLRPSRAGADEELRRLRYSRADQAATSRVLAAADRALSADVDRSAARRVVHQVGPELIDAVIELAAAVARADTNLDDGPSAQARVEALAAEVDAIRRTEGLDDPGPPLTGRQIMDALGLEPGPDIGRANKMLLEHRLEHGPLSPEEALGVLEAWWHRGSGRAG